MSFKTSHSVKKRKGRRTESNWRVAGYTYICPTCHNRNPEPVRNADGKPYCSSCMVKIGKFVEMKKLSVKVKK